MNSRNTLTRKFRGQSYGDSQPLAEQFERYCRLAEGYAEVENNIAVLSDLRSNESHIFYGGFARTLGLRPAGVNEVISSIWEDGLFRLIHPDDLERKHLEELCFYHFVNRQPRHMRADFYLLSHMRMKLPTNGYIAVAHRMFYILTPDDESVWLALCLYSPSSGNDESGAVVVNSVDGSVCGLYSRDNDAILSARQRQILRLIAGGCTSKDIAGLLSISKNTVSRHRQEILARLQVNNSIEACRTASELGLI